MSRGEPRSASVLLELYSLHLDCDVAVKPQPSDQAVLALWSHPGSRDLSSSSLHAGRSRKNKRRFEGGEKRAVSDDMPEPMRVKSSISPSRNVV